MGAKLAGGEQFFYERLDACERVCKIGIADFVAVHANAFIDFFQVWRGVQPGAKSSLPQNRFEKSSRRTLAVGSSNMSGGIGTVGASQALRQNGDVLEIEFCGGGLRRRSQFPAKREQVPRGIVVIHFSSVKGRRKWR